MKGPLLVVAMAAGVLGLPLAARAQQAGATPPPPNRLQVEHVKSGFVIAPDIRFGRINDRDARIVGAYGGWMTEDTLLVGLGGYWMANNSRDFKMAYGGAVVEWFVRGNRQTGVSARALVGGGRATLSNTYGELLGPGSTSVDEVVRFGRGRDMRGFDMRDIDRWRDFDPARIGTMRVAYTDNFFIAEPQINGFIRVTDWLRFNAGVGYRVIGGTSVPNMDERLRGLSGSVAIVFGGGS
jgi:hypothetical protein